MNKERAFLEIQRKAPCYCAPEQRLKNFNAVEIVMTDLDIQTQALRCMDCGVPFCHGYGCPLSNIIPEFNDHVQHGRWAEAWQIISETNPFPEFTGRICPAPCEASCVAGIHGEPVTIRQIELAIAERAFELGLLKGAGKSLKRRKESIAVVGSGPAGLAAAFHLNRKGFNVVVYEDAPKPGGILRYGIPNFKLEKHIVDRRIKIMEEEGIHFETKVEVGKDISSRYLHTRFEAVILAGGARKPRGLDVPGKEMNGIFFAMPYLVQQTRLLDGEMIPKEKIINAKNKNVVVIGGGDTGADCVGTSLRQGAKAVTQIEILPEPPCERPPETPWPEWPLILRESTSHKEGGKRIWAVSVKSIDGDSEGNVKKINAVKLNWKKNDQNQWISEEIKDSAFSIDCELILLAMGFVGPGKNQYVEELGLELDKKGFIVRPPGNMTNVSGVFVAGDMTQGASLVVRAIADGIKCAKSVIKYLEEK